MTGFGWQEAGGLVGAAAKGSISGSYATGAVAGQTAGGLVGTLSIYNPLTGETAVITDSYATGAVEGTHAAGGFIGINRYGTSIAISYATGPVYGLRAGGFAGDNHGIIRDSYASGAAVGMRYAGGFIGRNLGDGSVLRSYASGEVNSADCAEVDATAGELIGINGRKTTVTDSYWDTTVSRCSTTSRDMGTGKTTTQLQGPTGYTGIYASWDVDVDDADGDGDPATGKDDLWDFGTSSQYPALKADWNGDGTATAAEFGGQGRTLPQTRQTRRSLDSVAQSPVDYDLDDDGLIDIDSLAQLNALRWDLNGDGQVASGDQASYAAAFPNPAAGMGCHSIDHDGSALTPNQPVCKGYELTANLTFDSNTDNVIDSDDAAYWNDGAGWVPIAAFTYDFDRPGFDTTLEGNNHTIDYLFINRPNKKSAGNFVGLIGAVFTEGRIRNLNLTNVNVTGHHYVGGLVGVNAHGVVSDVAVSGTVSGDDRVGGLAGCYGCEGQEIYATIERSSSSGSITGNFSFVGGLVGSNEANITRGSSDATVRGKAEVGGLVGASHGNIASIVSSHATGDVTGLWNVGGLAGMARGGSISGSHATGAVEGNNAGGLVGEHGSITKSTGKNSVITSSYATGAVQGNYSTGGFVGINRVWALIAASYATGPVNGEEAGGFVGYNEGGIIRDSYASGSVTGRSAAGGFIAGYGEGDYGQKGSILRSYSSGEVTRTDDAEGGATSGGLIGMNGPEPMVIDIYCDTTVSSYSSVLSTGYTTAQLQGPTGYTGIYASWDVDVDDADGDGDPATGKDDLWDFGTSSQYPALKADWNGDGTATAAEFGGQGRTLPQTQQTRQTDNEAPTFADSSVTLLVAENTVAGADIGNPLTAADPDAGDTLTYTLGGTDQAHFAIDSASGQLQTKEALDYEDQSSYSVTVTATDGGGLTASIAVTIEVTDVNEPPAGPTTREVQGEPPGDEQPDAEGQSGLEGQPGNVRLNLRSKGRGVRVIWDAPEEAGAETYYQVRRRPDLAGSDYTVIASRVVDANGDGEVRHRTESSELEAEQTYWYSVRAFAGDGQALGEWTEGVSITLPAAADPVAAKEERQAPANQAPAYAAASATLSVAENTAANTNIGNPVAATDPDAGDTFTYTLGTTADDGHFAIDSATGQLRTSGALDYEGKSSYAVTVTATDGGGLAASIAVTVSVTDVNEAPAYANASASLSVAENTAAGADIANPLTAADPDAGDTLTYTLGGDDKDHFSIDSASGQLKTKGALDYEGKSSYAVTVTASDGDGLSASITVAINVTNVNEAPAYANASASLSVAENTATGADIGSPVTAADPDAGDTLTYTLGTTADDGHFGIDSASGQLRTQGALDYEGQSSYSLTVTATDSDGLAASIGVTVTVTDVADTPPGQPDAPGFIKVKETRFRITWTAPAAGSSPITGYGIQYKLASAEDSAYADVKPTPTGTGTGYNLVNRSGQTIAKETSYTVRVRARNTEGWGPWSDPAVAATAGGAPANQAPAYANASATVSVAENTVAGANIGSPVTATDSDAGDTLTYTLGTTADDGHFAINSATGQLQTNGPLDYESQSSYAVTVTASDGGGLSASIAVAINVTNVNEAPAYADDSATLSVAENTAANTNIGSPVAAADPDDGDTLTYALGGADQGHFAIDSATGQLQTNGPLDYESQSSYAVTVTASDGGGLSASIAVNVGVTDVAEQAAGPDLPEMSGMIFYARGRVTLLWDRVDGAKYYELLRDGAPMFVVRSEAKGKYYFDYPPVGADYEYRVTAYSASDVALATMAEAVSAR